MFLNLRITIKEQWLHFLTQMIKTNQAVRDHFLVSNTKEITKVKHPKISTINRAATIILKV
jgi:hypothetical protein